MANLVGEQGEMERTSGMGNQKRGLGGLGCTEDEAWNTKQGGEAKNILLSAYFVAGMIHIMSPSNSEARMGRVRRRMWKKGGCLWGGRTVPPGKESPQL